MYKWVLKQTQYALTDATFSSCYVISLKDILYTWCQLSYAPCRQFCYKQRTLVSPLCQHCEGRCMWQRRFLGGSLLLWLPSTAVCTPWMLVLLIELLNSPCIALGFATRTAICSFTSSWPNGGGSYCVNLARIPTIFAGLFAFQQWLYLHVSILSRHGCEK